MDLYINGLPAARFIKQAHGLEDENGKATPGFYDHDDPAQAALRMVKGWIEMAQHDALTEDRQRGKARERRIARLSGEADDA